MSNSCGCNGSGSVNSWIDWANTAPQDPLDLIAYSALASTVGVFSRVALPSATWSASPITLGSDPVCIALESDNQQMVADAAQWNFQHKTRNPDSTLALPLTKVIFLRGGTRWNMSFQIIFGAETAEDVMLTFRDNYGTRGDAQGTIPVISFGSQTGTKTLNLTLKSPGRVSMGIIATYSGMNSMYESEWIIVP